MPVDPLSIIGGVGAAAGIIVTITKTVKHLNDLQTKYKDAEMSITQLMRQLLSIKASLIQIQEWTELNLSRSPREKELVDAFGISFEGCKEAMDAMAEEVAKLVQDGINGDMRTMRTRYLWNEDTMKDHQGRLESQVQALQLLLSAVQW
jgi:DNA-directed RNA polymerase specialized sigma subunit